MSRSEKGEAAMEEDGEIDEVGEDDIVDGVAGPTLSNVVDPLDEVPIEGV